MKLVVVSQNGCVPCMHVKNFLKGNDVEFTEFNINTDDFVLIEGKEVTREELGIMSTPVTILFDGDEEIARVAGKDLGDLETLIEQL
jgi:glutaredoxin